jgi:hypothetical protein
MRRRRSRTPHLHREDQRQFLFKEGGTPEEYSAGLKFAIDQGWLSLHESGTYVKFTPAGADLFA